MTKQDALKIKTTDFLHPPKNHIVLIIKNGSEVTSEKSILYLMQWQSDIFKFDLSVRILFGGHWLHTSKCCWSSERFDFMTSSDPDSKAHWVQRQSSLSISQFTMYPANLPSLRPWRWDPVMTTCCTAAGVVLRPWRNQQHLSRMVTPLNLKFHADKKISHSLSLKQCVFLSSYHNSLSGWFH